MGIGGIIIAVGVGGLVCLMLGGCSYNDSDTHGAWWEDPNCNEKCNGAHCICVDNFSSADIDYQNHLCNHYDTERRKLYRLHIHIKYGCDFDSRR
jgi:hypothetical protein